MVRDSVMAELQAFQPSLQVGHDVLICLIVMKQLSVYPQ